MGHGLFRLLPGRMPVSYTHLNLIGEILDTENPKEPTEFMKKELDVALAKLDNRNQDFILSYFRDGKTYREIGEAWNLSLIHI